MAKNINIKLAVKDQFTAPLKNASKSTQAMDRQIKRTQRSIKKFANSAKASLKKVAKSTAVMAGAGAAAMGVFLKNSVDAAKVQIEQETKLQAVLMNTNGMRMDQIESIKKYAGELQNVGVIGDEVALAGVQQMGSYQLQADTLKKLMPGMNDLLVQQKGLNASTGDAVTIGNMIGKVMTGQVGALTKAGINFSKAQERVLKFGNEQEKAAVLAKVLQKNVGGVNKAMAETDQGRIKQASNAYGDMQEVVGKLVLPYLAKLAAWFKDKIPVMESYIQRVEKKIVATIELVKPYLLKARELFGKITADATPALKQFGALVVSTVKKAAKTVEFFVKHWDRLSPIIWTVVGAMAAYKVTMLAMVTYTTAMVTAQKIKASWDAFGAAKLSVLTAAQWAYNVALNANPIGLVIGAIGILVGAGVALYKNWDIVTAKCKGLWTWVKKLWKTLWNNPIVKIGRTFLYWVSGIGLAVGALKLLGKGWNLATEKCKELWTWIKELWASLDNNPIAKIAKTFLTLLNPIAMATQAIQLLGKTWDSVKGFWDDINPFSSDDGKDPKDPNGNGNGDKPKPKGPTTDPTPKPQPGPMPGHALGTKYFQGGATRINEGGRGEMAVLPSGTAILPHSETRKASNGNKTVNVTLNVQGNVIGNTQFMEQCGQHISKKILAALGNM